MENRKNIAVVVATLVWLAVLCFSVFYKAQQLAVAPVYTTATSEEHLEQEYNSFATAWSEEVTEHGSATNTISYSLSTVLLACGFVLCFYERDAKKVLRSAVSLSSISLCCKILPNGP
ncbi:hypothetical protein ACFSKU_16065 [Pontibacter silvestris]|uniref:Uncharacterized protein n=1 Tax=Pontibacter silvestris TaxID=2305183 RepID=A0ABW4X207_9BACT|nr:hypothetical protein [Pontibacter silvestris]MCC9135986.1 hypothetical protein [Pontibacter silvestris]